jgi:hypothetical protein
LLLIFLHLPSPAYQVQEDRKEAAAIRQDSAKWPR